MVVLQGLNIVVEFLVLGLTGLPQLIESCLFKLNFIRVILLHCLSLLTVLNF